ncbi:MAG: 30S ribosomal protein S8 [Candidatus Nealsonbacteria bacterium]
MDPIADMLTSIRNAQAVSKETVEVPFSKLKFGLVKILEKEGFIEKIEKKGRGVKKIIEIKLKYEDKKSAISYLKRISKPGQRIYFKSQGLKPVRSGYGITIISTSKGLMTGREAKKKKIGGEVLCQVW